MDFVQDCFSRTFQEARAKFRAAAGAAGYTLRAEPHPLPGQGGQILYTDIARKGPVRAEKILLTTSGIHGIEGFAGSAIQTRVMRSGMLPVDGDLAIVHVHALNPHGFDRGRRVNEDNIDLNRNFVDWGKTPPKDHPLNTVIQSILLHPPGFKQAFAQGAFILRHGMTAARDALMRGQYSMPEGLFYGGAGPAWTNILWRKIIAAETPAAKQIAHIDIHTGLGPRGHGEIIVNDLPSGEMYRRARYWWGKITSPLDGSAVGAPTTGDMCEAFEAAVKGRTQSVTSVTLEFGTMPPLRVLAALAADNRAWLAASPPRDAAAVRRMMENAFYPADPVWRSRVLARGREAVKNAAEGLSSPEIR